MYRVESGGRVFLTLTHSADMNDEANLLCHRELRAWVCLIIKMPSVVKVSRPIATGGLAFFSICTIVFSSCSLLQASAPSNSPPPHRPVRRPTWPMTSIWSSPKSARSSISCNSSRGRRWRRRSRRQWPPMERVAGHVLARHVHR